MKSHQLIFIFVLSAMFFLTPTAVFASNGCVNLPVLMYHHIQPWAQAKSEGQTSLTVDTSMFDKHIAYLKDKGYNSISPQNLIDYYNQHQPLPAKPVLITVDDGYSDFYTDAAPILKKYAFKATAFIPTGLVDNPHYLSWANISELSSSGLFYFANHTWSHHSLAAAAPVIDKEVTLAQTQLTDHANLDSLKVFAYPYGTVSKTATSFLQSQGYQLAFTTHHGRQECAASRLVLPRIRIGNAPLSHFGL